jgi:hypothetical protein
VSNNPELDQYFEGFGLKLAYKTPEEWLQTDDFRGLVVMDPDGWRGKNAPAWDEPITAVEFNHRLCMSTVLDARVVQYD